MGHRAEGIQKFNEGIEIDPNFPDNYEYLAQIIMFENEEEAKRLIKKCIEIRPNDS